MRFSRGLERGAWSTRTLASIPNCLTRANASCYEHRSSVADQRNHFVVSNVIVTLALPCQCVNSLFPTTGTLSYSVSCARRQRNEMSPDSAQPATSPLNQHPQAPWQVHPLQPSSVRILAEALGGAKRNSGVCPHEYSRVGRRSAYDTVAHYDYYVEGGGRR